MLSGTQPLFQKVPFLSEVCSSGLPAHSALSVCHWIAHSLGHQVSFLLPLSALSTLLKLSIHNHGKQSKIPQVNFDVVADPSPVLTSGNWTYEGFGKAVKKQGEDI